MKLKDVLKAKFDEKLGKHGWYNSFTADYGFRTLVFYVCGSFVTAAFAVYYAVCGALYQSLWYGAYAIYLIMLAVQRLLVLAAYFVVHKKHGGDVERIERGKLKIYLANGAIFVPLTVALVTIIGLIMSLRKPLVSNGIMAITTAAYATYKITMAIINLVKARSFKDPLIQTMRNIGIVDALTSVILLESTLITTFGEMTGDLMKLTAILGLAVCLFNIGLGSHMIIKGAKRLNIKPDYPHH